MCGLLGIVQAQGDVVPALIAGLQRLEYRGYDSAGVGVHTAQSLEKCRVVGRVDRLKKMLKEKPLQGMAGIAHTRWATHGGLAEKNAHPQGTQDTLLVHNGIIENADILRMALKEQGVRFTSDTDTEVLAVLIDRAVKTFLTHHKAQATHDFLKENMPHVLREALAPCEGSFAVVVLVKALPNCLVAMRQGFSPLALGRSMEAEKACHAVGSDAVALAGLVDDIAYLEDGDVVVCSAKGAEVFSASGKKAVRFVPHPLNVEALTRQGYAHFMLKEIHEQPRVLRTIASHYHMQKTNSTPANMPPDFLKEAASLYLTGCGTALYAAEVAAYFFEHIACLPVRVQVASEMQHRLPYMPANSWVGAISQSGETADTLAALKHVHQQSAHSFGVLNVQESSIARQVHHVFPLFAGPEVSVASTKAFSGQLGVLLWLCLHVGNVRGILSKEVYQQHVKELLAVASKQEEALKESTALQKAACRIAPLASCLYLGRGSLAPLALEGALKMKEISYVHAEGYAAGELKHGPIALLTKGVPVVLLAPSDTFFSKNMATLQEVRARGATVILLTDREGATHVSSAPDMSVVILPHTTSLQAPFVYVMALQFLAYHTALLRGTDVDRPRNLAKSVTVE